MWREDDEWIPKYIRGRHIQHNPERQQIYDNATGEVMSVDRFFVRAKNGYFDNKNEGNNMNDERNENKVRPIREGGRSFYTRTNRVRDGHIGQVMAGETVVWDSELNEDAEVALKAANDKLDEVLKAQFA